ncbi:MAG: FAD-dependent oxidoreductase, partial [Rubrivivax sp.]
MDGDCDVTIVGAGIAGASLAAQLAPQARVALVEREAQPGQHSTGRSAAMFMESYGPPQARALTRASRAFYAAPPAGFSDVPLLSPRGVLYVAWNGQQALLDETERRLSGGGSSVDRRSAAQALAAVPVLRAAGLLGALAEPDAMDIDVHALHQGWLRAARRAGAALHCGAELAAATPDGAGWRLTLADGRSWRCTVVVDAAGAWADEVATRCGAA